MPARTIQFHAPVQWYRGESDRADCSHCDWEVSGADIPVLSAARKHKRENPDHLVTRWREWWQDVEPDR